MDEFDKKLRDIIIKKIKEKKELTYLNNNFISKELAIYILNNKKIYLNLKDKFEKNPDKIDKSRQFKKTIKDVRTKLREVFGVFYEYEFDNAYKLINEITKTNAEGIAFEILKLHKSSKERLRNYEEIYDKIFEITKIKPKIILDLAAGFNPFSYFFLEESFGVKPEYYCCDLSNKDILIINKFFENCDIKGKAFYCDLTSDISRLENINADICFLFKTLDSLETSSRNISKNLFNLNSKFFIVSFPTRSIGGNALIPKERRAWFYKFLKESEFEYTEFETHNELFIVIKKKI